MEVLQENKGGFDFDLVQRNAFLEKGGVVTPKMNKTGTTICGVVFKDGVVLGADTRATNGPQVADKNCEKIHFISKNIWCCGAGTSADTENTTGMVASKVELHRLATGKQPRVITALTMLRQHLFRYQGHVSAALVLGGVDATGPHLHTVYPHGSTDTLPYVTMGSGSLAAMGVFESGYRKDLELEEAVSLVQRAIRAGIFNDLYSGGNVDVCVITKDNADMRRNYEVANPRSYRREKPYHLEKGSTAVLKTKITPISNRSDIVVEDVAMSES